MTWNYRVLKSKDGEDDWYQIHETYYDKEKNVNGWAKNGATVCGNTLVEIRSSLELMLKSLDKEILNKNKMDINELRLEVLEQILNILDESILEEIIKIIEEHEDK